MDAKGASDRAWSVGVCQDNSFVLAGETDNSGNVDAWVVKISKTDGSLVWQKAYGGASDDRFNACCVLSNRRIVLAGETGSFDAAAKDLWLVKIRGEDGTINWQKRYGWP